MSTQSEVAGGLTRQELNSAVTTLAKHSRKKAEEILANFGVMNTAVLPTEKWQAVFDATAEALKTFSVSP
jgi:hypothetical protein